MGKYDFDKIKQDVKKKRLKEMASGKVSHPKEKERSIKDFPDKAYDPNQLFRQQDNADGSRTTQRIEDVVEQEITFPDKEKGGRFKELRNYLKSMNLKK